MKRTRFIDLAALRKKPAAEIATEPAGLNKPTKLSMAVAGALGLGGCSSDEAMIYTNIYECKRENPSRAEMCRYAYEAAQEEAIFEAPRYGKRSDCEYDFGEGECRDVVARNGIGFDYIPLVAAFMLPRGAFDYDRDDGFELDIDYYRGDRYRSKPLFTSRSRRSPAYGNWVTGSGNSIGRTYSRTAVAKEGVFKSAPVQKKTLSRGGFGSTVKAKSSWGGSSKSSWGGGRSWGG